MSRARHSKSCWELERSTCMVITVTVGPPIEISGLALDCDRTSVSTNGRGDADVGG
jgi:hypothetical protein